MFRLLGLASRIHPVGVPLASVLVDHKDAVVRRYDIRRCAALTPS
jgi:hypothetical protein